MNDFVIERLSGYAHSAWSGWMKYMFSKSMRGANGSLIIPAPLVARWERQSQTSYSDLPEQEKASDRAEAYRIIEILDASGA